LVGELFLRHAAPWKAILDGCAQEILEAVRETISSIIRHVADAQTADELLKHVILPALESLKQELLVKISFNLENHKSAYLVSYHKQFTDNMQKARQESRKEDLSEKLHKYFQTEPGTPRARQLVRRSVNVTDLLERLCAQGEDSGVEAVCLDALNCMQAYYKVYLSGPRHPCRAWSIVC
jgi:hypothetical protein